jgi:hypothetical protein
MKYYAKIIVMDAKIKKFLVEIWETMPIGESSHDQIKNYKSFFTSCGAQKWIIKELVRYNIHDKVSHFFITDQMIFRKEI